MTPKLTPGRRLRADMDTALAEAGKKVGKTLEWDEHELQALAAAASAADRKAELDEIYRRELDGDARPAVLVKLSTEVRMLEKAVGDHLSRVQVGVGVAKSDRHQRAAKSRWDRRAGGA